MYPADHRLQRILQALPATAPELAAREDCSVKVVHAHLSILHRRTLAHKTDLHGQRHQTTGPQPRIWERN